MQYNPGKYYLISFDKKQGLCCVSPFEVHTVRQSTGDTLMFGGGGMLMSDPVVNIEGQLYGTMKILKAVDIENVTYEEIMELLKE